jgi:hypothetical protein
MRRVVSAPPLPSPPTPTTPLEPLQPDGPDPLSNSDSDKENQAPTYATNREVQEVQEVPSNWHTDNWTWTPCDWSTTATTGNGPSPTDPLSDEEEEDPPTTLRMKRSKILSKAINDEATSSTSYETGPASVSYSSWAFFMKPPEQSPSVTNALSFSSFSLTYPLLLPPLPLDVSCSS